MNKIIMKFALPNKVANSYIYRFLKRFYKRYQLKKKYKTEFSVRVVIGSAGICDDGWICTDIDILNLLDPKDWENIFQKNSINAILAEHVWEHLTFDEGLEAAQRCYEYLKPGGYLRVAIPDGNHPDQKYIEYVKVGGSGLGADDHKVLYTYKLIGELLSKSGFKINFLEYFDENGTFHYVDWDSSSGKIHRSIRFDKRNHIGKPIYTSIIVDGIKE